MVLLQKRLILPWIKAVVRSFVKIVVLQIPPPPHHHCCEEETISWVSCDGCVLWWHITCLGFDMETRLSQNWLKCNEVWCLIPNLEMLPCITQQSSFFCCLLGCFFVQPIIIDIFFLPIDRYDNLNVSFVNLSQVLKD